MSSCRGRVCVEFAGFGGGAGAVPTRSFRLSGIAAIVLLLSIVTSNWRNLRPCSRQHAVWLAACWRFFATGGLLALGAMVGFVTLFGITLRNSIMMISHCEGLRWGVEAAIEGAGDRLAPILMTSLVTALGLLPLAVGMDNIPGREVEGPMALVILGGLLTSMT